MFTACRTFLTWPRLGGIACAGLVLGGAPMVKAASYEHHVPFDPAVAPEEIIRKAARVVPSRAQLMHHQDGFIGFIHFGPNTFSGVEWGSGKENPEIFNPGETLDTDQWCRIMKAAGMTKVVITVKHHDGFCLWQTRYNDTFSVRSIPWRDGRGDVLRELSTSCRAHGLKLGVYLSPADLYQIESPTGWYGNLSTYQPTVIPTDVDAFATNPMRARDDRPAGAPTFTVEADDYNRYFMNQLYELLTEYGPIHEVWFDGAHPKRKGGQRYIKTEWFDMIRELAPEAVIFGGPDVRWCGNEGGNTRESEWNVLPVQDALSSGLDRPAQDLGSDRMLLASSYEVYGADYQPKYLYYLISEVDTSIRAGWFWRNDHEQSVRTPDDVFDIYERSVGGNATLLLNVPPSNLGRISTRDEQCLLEVGRRIRTTYQDDLLHGATVRAEDGGGNVPRLMDGDLATYWQVPNGGGSLVVTLAQPRTLNRFLLQEAVGEVGQRIKSHALDAWFDGGWQEIAAATTVGYRRILRFPAVTTDRLRVRVLDARLTPTIAEISAHYYQPPLPPVAVSPRADGQVILKAAFPENTFNWKTHGRRPAAPETNPSILVHYTLDGSEPSADAPVYAAPLVLPNGGHLLARAIVGEQLGPITERRLGLAPGTWRILDVSSEQDADHSASKAIDADPTTFWSTSREPSQAAHPHELTIDLGREIRLAGLTYLPRQDARNPEGMVESGVVEVRREGGPWQTAGQFRFGNLLNDPTRRTILFEPPPLGRHLRFRSAGGAQETPHAGAAELGVLPAR